LRHDAAAAADSLPAAPGYEPASLQLVAHGANLERADDGHHALQQRPDPALSRKDGVADAPNCGVAVCSLM
jgi:hypothetical protein